MPFENACLSQEQVVLFRGKMKENVIISCDTPEVGLSDSPFFPFPL